MTPRDERNKRLRDARHDSILTAAVSIAEAQGITALRRNAVAERAGVAAGSINFAFGSFDGLKRAVVEHAVANRILRVVAQAVALNIAADAIPPEIRQEAACALAG